MRTAIAGTVHLAALADHLDDDAGLLASARPADSTPGTQLVQELLRRGHDVGVAMLAYDVDQPAIATGPRLSVHVSPQRRHGRGRDVFAAERRALSSALQRLGPDVVHAQWTYEYALAALATGRPTVVTMRDWAPKVLRLFPDPFRLVRFGMNAAVVMRAPHLTVTSPFMQSRLRRVRRRGVHLVPNGLRDEEIVERPRTTMGDPPRVLSLCNGFSRMKNTGSLLEAMAVVRRRRPDVVLEMLGVGHGPGESAQTWASERGLAQGVVFVGHVPREEAVARLDAADVLGHPAREEPFGMAVVEAMGRGVPVVAGRGSGAPPWLLDDGRAGVLVDADRPASIADGILSLLDDTDRWRDLSAAALQRVQDEFRLSRSVETYLQLYDRARAMG